MEACAQRRLIRVHNSDTQTLSGVPKSEAKSMREQRKRKSCHSDQFSQQIPIDTSQLSSPAHAVIQ
jgi:hypothetical protein